jgi:hypothetical protein
MEIRVGGVAVWGIMWVIVFIYRFEMAMMGVIVCVTMKRKRKFYK